MTPGHVVIVAAGVTVLATGVLMLAMVRVGNWIDALLPDMLIALSHFGWGGLQPGSLRRAVEDRLGRRLWWPFWRLALYVACRLDYVRLRDGDCRITDQGRRELEARQKRSG